MAERDTAAAANAPDCSHALYSRASQEAGSKCLSNASKAKPQIWVRSITRPISASPSADDTLAARRVATHRATRRRRRVLSVMLLAVVAVAAAGVAGRLALPYVAIPVGLLLAWLVACRLMVRRERAWETARMHA